jgi:hypothetical protein
LSSSGASHNFVPSAGVLIIASGLFCTFCLKNHAIVLYQSATKYCTMQMPNRQQHVIIGGILGHNLHIDFGGCALHNGVQKAASSEHTHHIDGSRG